MPAEWDEAGYLAINPDVAAGVSRGTFVTGYHHYLAAGRVEGRVGGFPTKDWNDALYVAVNQDVAAAIARNDFKSGRAHWELSGRPSIVMAPRSRRGGTSWDICKFIQTCDSKSQRRLSERLPPYLAAGRRRGAARRIPAGEVERGGLSRRQSGCPHPRSRSACIGSDYLHYIAVGEQPGRIGGFPAAQPDGKDYGCAGRH